MPIANGKKSSGIPGIKLIARDVVRDAILQFDDVVEAPTTATGYFYLYVDNGVLYYDNGSSAVALGQGGGSTPTWDTIYNIDKTLTLDSTTLTFALEHATNNGLTITGSAGSAGHCLVISNAGTGYDVYGTSGTWYITKAGVAVFTTGSTLAGTTLFGSGSATGTITSNGAYDLVLETNSGTNSSKITITDAANGAITLAMNGTGSTVISGTTTHNTALTVSAGDMELTLGNFYIISDWNTEASLSVVNDTATTVGAAADLGVVQISSESLTTGILLNLSVDETGMNGGYFFRCWSQDAGAYAFRIGELGITNIAGSAGNNTFTITAGDVVWSDGSLAITDADNAASLTVTNSTATSASVVVLVGAGAFTGSTTSSWMTVTPSGLTTGTAVYLPLAALTEGKGLHITAGVSVTTGNLLYVQDTGANSALTSGSLVTFDHTATAITGTVNKTGALLNLTSSRTVTTGTVADDFDGVSIVRTAIINGAGAMTSAGSCLYIQTVVTNTSGTITSTTNGIEIVMDADGSGDGISLTHSAITGKAINIISSGTTAAGIFKLTANSLTTGQMMYLTTSATAMTSVGRIFLSEHSGATGTSTVLNEFKSTATDETVVMQVTASGTLIGGVAAKISVAAMTTGVALTINDANALTTGSIASLVSNSADATARNLVLVHNDHASAVGAVPLAIRNDAVTGTGSKFVKLWSGSDGSKTVACWLSIDATTPNGNLTGTAGDVCLNGPSSVPFYCTGTTNWSALA